MKKSTVFALSVSALMAASPAAAQQQRADQQITQEAALDQGTEIFINPASVRQIQQRLNQRGYDPGAVDGQWGSSTSSAVMNFQQANGLEPTGNLNMRTLAALGAGQLILGGGQQGAYDQQITQEIARQDGTQLYASPATVRLIQQRLNQLGYDAGNLRGEWDRAAQRAIKNFQQAQGLEPTGQLNFRTIAQLGLEQQIQQFAQNVGAQQGVDQQLTQEIARGEGAPLHITPASVRQIQLALNSRGYDAGNVQGVWDRQTRNAMRNFQQAAGLEPTGSLNMSSVQRLGIGQGLVDVASITGMFGQGGSQAVAGLQQQGQTGARARMGNQQFGQGSQQFGQGNQQFGQGSQQFGQGNQQFGQGSQQFGQGSQQFGQSGQFGQRSQQFGQSGQFGQRNQQFGQNDQFGQRNQAQTAGARARMGSQQFDQSNQQFGQASQRSQNPQGQNWQLSQDTQGQGQIGDAVQDQVQNHSSQP